MEIVKLPIGEPASVDTDCLRIEQLPDQRYSLTATALCVAPDDAQSVSIVGGSDFDTAEQAEAAGTAWAVNVGVERLFVSIGTLDRPLKLLEIDKPL